MEPAELIVDDRQSGIFRVHRSAMTSEDILAVERQRIFSRCWLSSRTLLDGALLDGLSRSSRAQSSRWR